MKSVMLDIETLSTEADAKILQVAFVAFDDEYKPIDQFCINIDPETQPELSEDERTIKWWSEQPSHVIKSVLSNQHSAMYSADVICDWLKKQGKIQLWTNHTFFDVPILNNFLKLYSKDKNIFSFVRYNNIHDYATLREQIINQVGKETFYDFIFDEYKKVSSEEHKAHNALDDCLLQIFTLEKIQEMLFGEE